MDRHAKEKSLDAGICSVVNRYSRGMKRKRVEETDRQAMKREENSVKDAKNRYKNK